jgi:hypothetical protein
MKLKDIIKMFDPLSAIIIYETGEEMRFGLDLF